jgi:hypothetical protein
MRHFDVTLRLKLHLYINNRGWELHPSLVVPLLGRKIGYSTALWNLHEGITTYNRLPTCQALIHSAWLYSATQVSTLSNPSVSNSLSVLSPFVYHQILLIIRHLIQLKDFTELPWIVMCFEAFKVTDMNYGLWLLRRDKHKKWAYTWQPNVTVSKD